MSENLKLRIGDVAICIEGNVQKNHWAIPSAYRPFVGPGKTAIFLRFHRGIPETKPGEKVFDSPPIWSLYHKNGTLTIRIFDAFPDLKRALVLTGHFKRADLYCADGCGRFCNPFYGPTMELLMVNYLAQGWGAIIHSCGIARSRSGILFVGESGAGKSTMAKMWSEENGVDVLSDDRIIVRKKNHCFWMYGTPWHGDASFVSPRGVTLERIFFLRHGQENSMKEIKGIDPVSRLITCSFLPHWDPQGMAFSMDFFTDLVAHVPCYEFTFKPDRSVIEVVMEITE
jgi:hypothetical protein